MKTFRAPWGKTLFWMSALFTVICIGVTVVTLGALRDFKSPMLVVLQWLPLVLPFACVPFIVRGYVITDDAILIRRLFWSTRYERAFLRSAEIDSDAMKGSIRTCGNGGGYSFTGWYWSKRLGAYRCFVNDLNRAVVLRFATRTIVVSPDDPRDFVATLGLSETPA